MIHFKKLSVFTFIITCSFAKIAASQNLEKQTQTEWPESRVQQVEKEVNSLKLQNDDLKERLTDAIIFARSLEMSNSNMAAQIKIDKAEALKRAEFQKLLDEDFNQGL